MRGVDFVCATYSMSSFAELRDACVAQYQSLGVTMISYHHLPPIGATDFRETLGVLTIGFPDDWVRNYLKKEYYKCDPITRLVYSRANPLRWSDVYDMPGLSAEEREYLGVLRAADFGDGLAIPLYGPMGRNGYNGFGFGKGAPHCDDHTMAELWISAQAAHLRYCHLLREQAAHSISLSKREKQVLEKILRGRSNPQIAQDTGVTLNTIDTYVRRIFDKLDVTDRTTAALRALALGLI